MAAIKAERVAPRHATTLDPRVSGNSRVFAFVPLLARNNLSGEEQLRVKDIPRFGAFPHPDRGSRSTRRCSAQRRPQPLTVPETLAWRSFPRIGPSRDAKPNGVDDDLLKYEGERLKLRSTDRPNT